MRVEMDVMVVQVPNGAGGLSNLTVARPAHPEDNVVVAFTVESINTLMLFFRSKGEGEARLRQGRGQMENGFEADGCYYSVTDI